MNMITRTLLTIYLLLSQRGVQTAA